MNSLEKSQSIVDSLTFGEGVNFDSYLHPDDQAKVKQASHWREKLKDFQFNPQKQSPCDLLIPMGSCKTNKPVDFRHKTLHMYRRGRRRTNLRRKLVRVPKSHTTGRTWQRKPCFLESVHSQDVETHGDRTGSQLVRANVE